MIWLAIVATVATIVGVVLAYLAFRAMPPYNSISNKTTPALETCLIPLAAHNRPVRLVLTIAAYTALTDIRLEPLAFSGRVATSCFPTCFPFANIFS
jgi:hypothetical protein